MYFDMTRRAVLEPRRRLIVEVRGVGYTYHPGVAVTLETELAHLVAFEQIRIIRTVRSVTNSAALDLGRRVLEHERTLLISMTLDAYGVSSGRYSSLF